VHIAQLNLVPTPPGLSPEAVLTHWPTLTNVADAAASTGLQVSVIQASATPAHWVREGVHYHFLDIGPPRSAQRSQRLGALLERIGAQVLHVHGLEFAADAWALAQRLPQLALLLQDHANGLPRWWRRKTWRGWYGAATGIAFTSLELAQPFVRARLFAPATRLLAIPESSTRFGPGPRQQARAKTGLYGDPCVLWIGHLSNGKDPLTVLEGIAAAQAHLPDLQLWCVYGQAPLREQLLQRVADDRRLAGRVHLLGPVPHAQVETLLHSADLFVSGSLTESCGYAVLEALACGVPPVLTDIPAFRALTHHGRVGALWPCGDARQLTAALLRAAADHGGAARARAHFQAHLSVAALGRQWAQAYAQVQADHGRSAA
jgi:glycosyltransferase involved in cell wall biosynthesis